jgi:hypothetical protein
MKAFWRGMAICIAAAAAAISTSCGSGAASPAPAPVSAAGDYVIDDGTAERAISIDSGEDALWFNTFPVQSGGEVIHSISVAFGRPGVAQALDGLPIQILLYEAPAGAPPTSAVLRQSVAATIANANTNALNLYPIPATEVHGALVAAVLFHNTSGASAQISALDQSDPTLSSRSYYAFGVGLDGATLSGFAPGQFGTIESLGQAGNWVLRANGTPLP